MVFQRLTQSGEPALERQCNRAGLGHSPIASLSDLTCAGDTGAQRVASAAPTHSSWLCEHGEAITPGSAAWEPAFYPGTNLDTRGSPLTASKQNSKKNTSRETQPGLLFVVNGNCSAI